MAKLYNEILICTNNVCVTVRAAGQDGSPVSHRADTLRQKTVHTYGQFRVDN